MANYTQVFGGTNIYPSDVSYSALALTGDEILFWPLEADAGVPVVSSIIDVTSDQANRVIYMPDAMQASNGVTTLFNNVGSYPIIVKSTTGVTLLSAAAGTTWQLYLTSNATQSGSWRAYQFGAAVSSANAATLAGNGLIAISSTLQTAQPTVSIASDYTVLITDRAYTFIWTGGAGTLTLPSAALMGNNFFIQVKNAGSGTLTVTPSGTNLIDTGLSLDFQPLDSALILTDGVDWYSVGLGQSAEFAFDYTVINVAGTGDYTLSSTELNRVAYSFTGVLTGNRNIIVPPTVQQYWVANNTTGSYTLTVKVSGGTGVNVNQGARTIAYSNGNDVVLADTSGLSSPIAINEGGTGATTVAGAQIALGLNPIDGGTY
ncbi:MAG: hypothetical protein ACR2IJ_09335 [Fluviibacter sp.]